MLNIEKFKIIYEKGQCMKVIDISWPITPKATEYKDKETIIFEEIKTFEHDRVRESKMTFISHTGTHIDSPSHFIKDGKTIDQMSLSRCIGACNVLDLMQVADSIGMQDLKSFAINPGDIVLLKTKNSLCKADDPFSYDFIYLDEGGANYLVDRGVRAVGIDYLGIERGQSDHPTHKALMKNDVAIIEGLRLEHVAPGEYFFCCLPMFLVGLDAAPARAVLIEGI